MKKHSKKHPALGVLIFLAVFAAMSALVMLLWNAIIPTVIGWTTVTYWQSAGLLVLCRLLLGGIGHIAGDGNMNKRRNKREMLKMREQMSGMSREERIEYIRKHMGDYPGHPGMNPDRDCC